MKAFGIVGFAITAVCFVASVAAASAHDGVSKDGGAAVASGDGGKVVEWSADGGKAVELAADGGK